MAIFGDSYTHTNISDNNVSFVNEDDIDAGWEGAMWRLVIEDFKQSQFTLSEPTTIVLIVLYVPIFLTSLIGNALVLLVIVPDQRMWSVTNNFLVNLSVADLLVTLLCVPMTVAGKVYRHWVYGEVLCKMTPYLQGVAVTSSTFTITAMSLDRCLAILHPMKFRSLRTKRNVRVLIFVVWATSLLLMIPLLFVNKTKTQEIFAGIEMTRCTEAWTSVIQRRAYDFSLLFIVCLIPAQIVFVSYLLMGKRLWVTDARLKGSEETKIIHSGSCTEATGTDTLRANRRRTAKMCIVVSLIFVVCWLPYYTVNIYLDFKRDSDALDIVYWGLLIGHLHCITNPILYCFMHKSFRRSVKRMLPCWRNHLQRGPSGYGSNAFYRYRMTSLAGSSRSRSARMSQTQRQQSSGHPKIAKTLSRDSDPGHPAIDRDQTSTKALVTDDEKCKKLGNGTGAPRRVKLMFARFKSHAVCQGQANSFKLVELPSSETNDSKVLTEQS